MGFKVLFLYHISNIKGILDKDLLHDIYYVRLLILSNDMIIISFSLLIRVCQWAHVSL